MNKSLPHNNDSAFFLQSKMKTYPISRFGLTSLILFIVGSFINFIAYFSIEPILIGLLFLLLGYAILKLLKVSGKYELQAFTLTFSVCLFWAGIAALYANFLNDPFQNSSDPALLYKLSSGDHISGLSTLEISSMSGGAIAIKIWSIFYNIFDFLGFKKGSYIGISINISFIAYTAVVGIRMVKTIFGDDNDRIRRFITIFVLCPVFWLFASIHLRDAAVLLAVTLLVYYWVCYLHDLRTSNMLRLGIATFVALLTFVFLRTQFIFVPIAMMVTGFATIVISKKKSGRSGNILLAVMLLLITSAYFVSTMWGDLLGYLTSGNEFYSVLSGKESGAGSLGGAFIVNQPLPVRLIAGFMYLLIFPIPFWSGFQLESAYHLFKSFHVVFMYAITPLFALAVLRVIKTKMFRTPPVLFLLFSFVGFTFSIAATSLETRHFGAFLPLLLVFSMIPDLSLIKDRLNYFILLTLFVSAMVLIHLVWAVMKFA